VTFIVSFILSIIAFKRLVSDLDSKLIHDYLENNQRICIFGSIFAIFLVPFEEFHYKIFLVKTMPKSMKY
jgi:hypothetical protein